MSESLRVAVVGATGYAGAELVRLLAFHPHVEIVQVTSSRSAGKPLRDECPWLETDLVLSEFRHVDADFTFLCQEPGFALEHAEELVQRTRVIDLSADFRLRDKATYEATYGRAHTAPDLGAVYGLPELGDRAAIASARLVANPGCYPTATLLALMPLQEAGLVAGTPVVDAKSGVSGAGRARKETDYLFTELSGGFRAYGVTGHRHVPEIEQAFGRPIRFTPHLIPTPRGLEVTAHVPLVREVDLGALYRERYATEPFVSVRSSAPTIKQVVGSNRCDLAATFDAHTGMAVVCAALDNLVKGAAGQAIQNMNLMAGLAETTGLPRHGVWP